MELTGISERFYVKSIGSRSFGGLQLSFLARPSRMMSLFRFCGGEIYSERLSDRRQRLFGGPVGGSTDVYGHPDYPADETASYRLRNWQYGDTKIEGERLVWGYYRQHDLPITVVRPVTIYGPRSTTFVLEIVELLKNGSMVHIGKGRKPAGLAYVTNVVDVLLRAADSENSVGQAYNASDGSDINWRQYVDRLAEIVGVSSPRVVIPYRLAYLAGWTMEKTYGALRIEARPLLTRMAAELFGTHQGFSINKARRELGYEPKVGFEEGMRRVEVWLRQIGSV